MSKFLKFKIMHQINKVFLHYKLSHLGPGDDSMTQMIVTSYLGLGLIF